ncbi:GNAT family N-acetyltransferase [Dyadobacter psychrotolerans]|uniref:GNAT family N-acetyltransferase n=1 Tax=Dyadobacter psychrotolerans TaxID=2541721 RepID=A0A4R5DFU0_9BACT|nr:GNAT family N-acetyltransferase [Dyadobacter psychrotolerans]TDE12047.1 GNAT family N-acetyltransferase [Dyadobacter psychrotolerans]
MSTLTYITKKGSEIESVFDDLAALRIAVFHDYPYLYEGNTAYEKEYLKTYSDSENSFLFAVYDAQKMVGATTCIPLKNETAEIRKPFEDAGFDINTIFYFGESILLPQYRGNGLGHRFFDEREAHARSFGNFKITCFCSVDRGEHHPSQPENYRPNDVFWQKRGYIKEPSLQSFMDWPDIGESESSGKKMVFWVRELDY